MHLGLQLRLRPQTGRQNTWEDLLTRLTIPHTIRRLVTIPRLVSSLWFSHDAHVGRTDPFPGLDTAPASKRHMRASSLQTPILPLVEWRGRQ